MGLPGLQKSHYLSIRLSGAMFIASYRKPVAYHRGNVARTS